MTNKKRFRLRFPFWLDLHKPDEAALAETIETLKTQRAFASSIRDGLRLIVDLRAGRLDVLFELFPFTKERLGYGTSTNSDLERRLDELQRLILEQGNITAPQTNQPVMKSAGGPKALKVPTTTLPHFDDDDDSETIVLKKSSNSSAGLNFITAAFSLQQ